jgi:hypothetical protein
VWWLDTGVSEDDAASTFRCSNPENHDFYLHCHENLKYYITAKSDRQILTFKMAILKKHGM